jgi:hypothetical protein
MSQGSREVNLWHRSKGSRDTAKGDILFSNIRKGLTVGGRGEQEAGEQREHRHIEYGGNLIVPF